MAANKYTNADLPNVLKRLGIKESEGDKVNQEEQKAMFTNAVNKQDLFSKNQKEMKEARTLMDVYNA